MVMKNNLAWLYQIKERIPRLLKDLKGNKRPGFYHYSLSGDYFGEKIKWGLGNSTFFLKIIYTLGFEKEYKQEIQEAIKFIKSFQKEDGSFSDPLVRCLSLPTRLKGSIKSLNYNKISHKQTIQAETRQAISSLSLFGAKPQYVYKDFPQSKNEINKYLYRLNWELPWGAGSHFSHLLFFLHYSDLKDKQELINYSIDWIDRLQHNKDGFWYHGNPFAQQKINGAMKIITGLKAVNKVRFNLAEKIINNTLLAINNEQACDNFNIVYVLKYCSEITKKSYRFNDIKSFMIDRLGKYKEYYYHNMGGFSFNKNKAGQFYYGAPISRGKREVDIHGTVMFLWGISIIAQILGINKNLKFKEFVT